MLIQVGIMKRPHFHRPNVDLHSIAFQTSLELAAGGVLTALLIRWLQM